MCLSERERERERALLLIGYDGPYTVLASGCDGKLYTYSELC